MTKATSQVQIKKETPTLVYGSDPEWFASIAGKKSPSVLPPAYFREYLGLDYIPDPKHPVFVDAMETDGIIIMEDGVAFELTVRPATNWEHLFQRIQLGKELLETLILSQFSGECNPYVEILPTIDYDVERWSKEGKEFQQCLIFGCDTDYNAWKANAKGKVVNALKHEKRYGGGHIHFSGVEEFREDPVLAVKCLSLTAGIAAVAFSDMPELDRARTYLYGQPGKYRFQQYKSLFEGIPNTDFGIEYRTPSNRWTANKEHAAQIFKWANFGIFELLVGGLHTKAIEKFGDLAKDAIINCNQEVAKQILVELETL